MIDSSITKSQKSSEYDKKMLQPHTNPQHREEEINNINSHMTTRTQPKQNNQPHLPQPDDCKTRRDMKYRIKKQEPNTNPHNTTWI